MPDEPAEQLSELGHRMMAIANEVKGWREITSKPNRVEPHSSLAADDALFTVVPVSHLILFGITHAVDHLDMYMSALVDSQLSFPIAPQTLARGGLLGAAHALWMLDEPDRRTRQLRGLRIVHEEWRNERNAYQDLVDRGEAVDGLSQLIDTRKEWMGRAIEAGESIGWTKAHVTEKPNDTKLIEAVLTRYEATEPQGPGEMSMSALYLIMWRMLSGAAHGYRWSSMPNVSYPTIPGNDVPSGSDVDGYLTADEDQHFLAAGALSMLIRRAFEFYDLRRVPYTRWLPGVPD